MWEVSKLVDQILLDIFRPCVFRRSAVEHRTYDRSAVRIYRRASVCADLTPTWADRPDRDAIVKSVCGVGRLVVGERVGGSRPLRAGATS